MRYWVVTCLPGGKQKKEFVGFSVQEARDAKGKRKGQKRETAGRFFDILPGLETTFNDLTAWYLDLKQVQRLASYKSICCVLRLFNEDFVGRSSSIP